MQVAISEIPCNGEWHEYSAVGPVLGAPETTTGAKSRMTGYSETISLGGVAPFVVEEAARRSIPNHMVWYAGFARDSFPSFQRFTNTEEHTF
jgi:hypothetical protein